MSRLRATLLIALFLAYATVASAQPAIILVRHAERQTGEGDDGLSEAGRQRAERLATVLKDAGVTHIFVSDRRRTVETAMPFAKQRNLSPTQMTIPAQGKGRIDPSELQVRATLLAISKLPRTAIVLVVGHSNTVPTFLTRLGYDRSVKIAENEFDNMFVVTTRATRAPSVIRLRF